MNEIVPYAASGAHTLVSASGARAETRFWEFFAANIRNKNTRRAYAIAARGFLAWCERAGVASIADVKPLHVAAYIEQLGRERSAPTVKQRLAAIRHLFDWLVTGQVRRRAARTPSASFSIGDESGRGWASGNRHRHAVPAALARQEIAMERVVVAEEHALVPGALT